LEAVVYDPDGEVAFSLTVSAMFTDAFLDDLAAALFALCSGRDVPNSLASSES
jgi:hypothetical protein